MALHPNRYNRTSEAYDFTLFEGKEPEDKYTVHRKSKELAVGTGTGKEEGRLQTQSKSHVYRIKKQRSRARTFRVVVSCFLLVIALGATGSIIFNQVQLTELTEEIDTAAQQLEESQSVYTQLQSKCKFIFGNGGKLCQRKFRHEKNRPESIGFCRIIQGRQRRSCTR